MTERGPYQPAPDLQLNIMKAAVENDPDMLEAAVKFLKFMTTPENNSAMILEMGSDIGAVIGADVPPLLIDWLNQPFAIVPKTSWPGAFTAEYNVDLNKNLQMWVSGQLKDDEFYAIVNNLQQKGADAYIESAGVDTSGW
jgi:hypothetical protein